MLSVREVISFVIGQGGDFIRVIGQGGDFIRVIGQGGDFIRVIGFLFDS